MARNPTRELVAVCQDQLNACPESEELIRFDTPQIAYESDQVDFQAYKWWWVEAFIQDAGQKRRMRAALYAVDEFFRNLARLHYAETGKPVHIPRRLVNGVLNAMLQGMYPTVEEIAREATAAPADVAVKKMIKLGVFDNG